MKKILLGLVCAAALMGAAFMGAAWAADIKVINADAWFPEGPVWYQGKLYYVEYGRNTIMTWDGTKNDTFWKQDGCGPSAVVTNAAGETEAIDGSYLVSAEGARSIVRKDLDIEFEGFTYPDRTLNIEVAYDFRTHGYTERNYISDPDEWSNLFHWKGPPDRWRVHFPTAPDADETALTRPDALQARLQRFLPVGKAFDIVGSNLSNSTGQLQQSIHTMAAYLQQHGFSAADATKAATAHFYAQLETQTRLLGFMDCFHLVGWITLAVAPLVLLIHHFKVAGKAGPAPNRIGRFRIRERCCRGSAVRECRPAWKMSKQRALSQAQQTDPDAAREVQSRSELWRARRVTRGGKRRGVAGNAGGDAPWQCAHKCEHGYQGGRTV